MSEEHLDKLNKIIARLNVYTQDINYDGMDDDNSEELMDILFTLEDLGDEVYAAQQSMKPLEVSALCLFCGSKFLRSQGHNCLNIKTNRS